MDPDELNQRTCSLMKRAQASLAKSIRVTAIQFGRSAKHDGRPIRQKKKIRMSPQANRNSDINDKSPSRVDHLTLGDVTVSNSIWKNKSPMETVRNISAYKDSSRNQSVQ